MGGVIATRPPSIAIIPLSLFCLLHIWHVALIPQTFFQVNMTSADQLQSFADILHGDPQVDVDECGNSNSDKSDKGSDRDGDDEAEHDDDEGEEDFDSDSGSDKKRKRSCAPCDATTKRARSMPSTATRQPSFQSVINNIRDVYPEFAFNEQLPNIKQFKLLMTRELANTAVLCALKDVLNEDVVQGGVMTTEVVNLYQLVWNRLTSRHITFITAHRFVRCSTGTDSCCTACCRSNRHGPLRLLRTLCEFISGGHGIPGVDCCFCSCHIFSKYQIWSSLLTVLCLVKQTLIAISTRTIRTTNGTTNVLPIGVRNLLELSDTRPSNFLQLHKEVTRLIKRLATIIRTLTQHMQAVADDNLMERVTNGLVAHLATLYVSLVYRYNRHSGRAIAQLTSGSLFSTTKVDYTVNFMLDLIALAERQLRATECIYARMENIRAIKSMLTACARCNILFPKSDQITCERCVTFQQVTGNVVSSC